jgi:hypothetical protein
MQKSLFALVLISALLAISCGNKKESLTPEPLSPTNPIIAGTQTPLNSNAYNITLKDEALKQKFLMSVAEIEGAPAPAGSAFANKIVSFEVKGKSVFMFEELDGQLASDTLATHALLAEFPIVAKGPGFVTFDFKEGMNHVFYRSSMYASDIAAGDEDGDAAQVFKIVQSYINKVELRGRHIFIDQFVRLETLSDEGNARNISTHLKYTFSTYFPNQAFKPRASNGQKQVGYFEAHPVTTAGSGETIVPIMAFSQTGQITFSLSRNIPAEYQEAVTSGVLYWNQVFGREFIKVDTLPEGISVHEPGYNIVQWLEWDTAGFAYADMQGDPLTGETLQAHVYMTSVFGKGGYTRAKALYKQLLASTESAEPAPHNHRLSLRGWNHATLCRYHTAKSRTEALGAMIAQVEKTAELLSKEKQLPTTEEEREIIFKRYANDYVRQVVAHEVGHTLGLRHNFAGTLSSNLSPKNYEASVRTYFLTGELPHDLVPVGTVMDYTPGTIASMTGAWIRSHLGSLPYDKEAIEWGYAEKQPDPKSFVPFCTDSHRAKGNLHDCKVWDTFPQTIEGAYREYRMVLESLALKLVLPFEFIQNKTPSSDISAKIKKVQLRPKADVQALLKDGLAPFVAMLSPEAEFVSIRRQYSETLDASEERDYASHLSTYVTGAAQELGGSFSLALEILAFKDGKPQTRTEIETLFSRSFKNLISNANEEEKALVLELLKNYLDTFERELLMQTSKLLAKTKLRVRDDKLSTLLSQIADTAIFAKSTSVLGTTEAGTEILRPLYQYGRGKDDLRSNVLALVANDFAPQYPSLNRELARVREQLGEKHKQEVKLLLGEATADDLSNELYDFLFFEIERFKVFE